MSLIFVYADFNRKLFAYPGSVLLTILNDSDSIKASDSDSD
jgi:hypothetical protein